VRELEAVLGQRLAHRNTRGLALTEAGRRLYDIL
jgi:DNA-binding transcriptional LysR family regulator